MKERLTIGELAKLRKVTIETLRHYDRIDLFKPHQVDKKTGYRYYSIFQSELLGTIIELRQIGMSMEEIKGFINNRNKLKSLQLLKVKHSEIQARIEELVEIEENLKDKIQHVEEMASGERDTDIFIREIGVRRLVTLDHHPKNQMELLYSILELEDILKERTPLLATNRLGGLIPKEELRNRTTNTSSILFVTAKDKTSVDQNYLRIIPAGTFACIMYDGQYSDRDHYLDRLYQFFDVNGYEIAGDAVQLVQIDITITDYPNEVTYEIQVPILRNE